MANEKSRLSAALADFASELVRPSSVGGAYLGAWTLLTLLHSLGDDRVNGIHAPSVHRFIEQHFSPVLIDSALLVTSVAVLIGMLLGAVAGVVSSARDRVVGRPPPPRSARNWRALALVCGFHLAFWAYDIALRPQLYEDWFYANGGVRAGLQVLLTHWLGPTGVVVVAVSGFAAWFLYPVRARLMSRVLRTSSTPRARAVVGSVVLVASLVALAELLGTAVTHASPARQPNVVIVAVDSLRPDRINTRTAPTLTALADRGTRFDHAYTVLPRTFPAWVSIATGRYPHHHGVRNMFPRWETRARDLEPVPRAFARAGYQTSVVSDFAGDIFRRVDLGFSRVITPTFNLDEMVRTRALEAQKALLPFLRGRFMRAFVPSLREMHTAPDARALTEDALDEIDRAGGRPFFVTVFYSSAHFPYAAPAPAFRRFSEPSYVGRFRYGKPELLGSDAPPTPDDVRQIRALYDGAVFDADQAIGELLRGLERRGLDRDTIVVATSDHGECLFEPGRGQGHGDHLFGSEAVAVPLIVSDPRTARPVRVNEVVQNIDIAPTLCELAGVRCPAGMDGRSLAAALSGGALAPKPAFAETGLWFTETIPEVAGLRLPYPDLTHITEVLPNHHDEIVIRKLFSVITTTAKHRMVQDGRYKLIYVPTRDGANWRLYDTETDPQERHELSAEQPAIRARLENELWSWMLDDEDMERSAGMLLPRAGRLTAARAEKSALRSDETP